MNKSNQNTLINVINAFIPAILQQQGKEFVDDNVIDIAIESILSMPIYKDIDPYKLADIIYDQHSSYYFEDAKMLVADPDREEWLSETGEPYKREIEWKYWNDYKELLLIKGMSYNIVDGAYSSIGKHTSMILSRLDDPIRPGPWDRRGMVVGDVQSGKTSNFIGLICKAADAGYGVIIVLTGMYNDLRSQTQIRLDEAFIGFDSSKDLILAEASHKIGVGKFPDFKNRLPILYHTNATEKGDFNKQTAQRSGTPPHCKEPIIIVTKKNKFILDYINSWLNRWIEKGSSKINNASLLLIDDECDSASINTKNFDEDDENYNPTSINYSIRDILRRFDKSAYVGYTATPFANILIKRDDHHQQLGEDLFPRDFILNIPKPDNHIGPDQFFGRKGDSEIGIKELPGYPLVKKVLDKDVLLPNIVKLKTDVIINELNFSLKEAIKSYILSCAARLYRGQKDNHNSMLIHVSHYVNVHTQLLQLVNIEIGLIRTNIMNANRNDIIWKKFRDLWNNNFKPISKKMYAQNLGKVHDWNDIRPYIKEAIKRTQVIEINGKSKEALDYTKLERQNIYQNYIAIGGNRLSRGLTLEGLTISYFLRTSKMYDTLMQMGRWFGYRDDFLDLCRIYTTKDLVNAYRHITLATTELQEEFDTMYASGGKPENWGLKIRSHPGLLTVTGYGKRHWGTNYTLTFDAKCVQTHNIFIDHEHCKNNTNAINDIFLEKNNKFDLTSNKIAYISSNISSESIIEFLDKYQAGPAWTPNLIIRYIESRNQKNELTDWTVAFMNAQDRNKTYKEYKFDEQPNTSFMNLPELLFKTERKGDFTPSGNILNLDKAILSKNHEMIDLNDHQKDKIKRMIKNGEIGGRGNKSLGHVIREMRPRKNGLLLLYPIYGKQKSDSDADTNEDISNYGLDEYPVFGAVISFSGKFEKGTEISYVFDQKLLRQMELFEK
ncbi:MAG: Z1 domain-containing protein [Bacteroidetes bacterium]|nr:Z1 domain-containing protein [Bacteroidota bacterium]